MKITALLITLFATVSLVAQNNLKYQKPSQEILELADINPTPRISINDDASTMLLLYRDSYSSIEDLSKPELRLAGLRIDPSSNISSRAKYIKDIKIKGLDGDPISIKGLPADPKIANLKSNYDKSKYAFTNTVAGGLDLWILDVESAVATKLIGGVNSNMGNPIDWFKDGESLLVLTLPKDRGELISKDNYIPTGPTVSENKGEKAQNRTYQDLLKNPTDEYNFEQLGRSTIVKVGLDGTSEEWAKPAIYSGVTFSPDGEHILVTEIKKPFSYIVTYGRFPSVTSILSSEGGLEYTVQDKPLQEEQPQGFDSTNNFKRRISWRADKPATITWVSALDGGDIKVDVPFRDQLLQLEAPFTGEAKVVTKTVDRMGSVYWGDDNIAVVTDRLWKKRNTRSYIFNPSEEDSKGKVIIDRSYSDRYSDPGSLVTEENDYGWNVLSIKGGDLLFVGDGYSAEGQFPFVNRFNIKSGKISTQYRSEYKDKFEDILRPIDLKKNLWLVTIESATDFPNYYIRDMKKGSLKQITEFANPFKVLESVHKEVIQYKREDGVDLSGTLYLPVGYDMEKKPKVPLIVWAYPREFKSKAAAGQSTANANKFSSISYGSMIYWVTKGYALLDGAAFPIIGEGDKEPNDTFIKQLVANGKAAIDAVDNLGYIDRERCAVGGHSYGAFMTANLLSHSDLFAAGIARSGAYNRTLTPFGFQSEERTYWDDPELYYNMAPFMHADKMKTPLLLIHGQADNNSGTYPMQSERYFNALKGLGAPVRLVMLPMESHGYSAKESIFHVLWEQEQWLDKYVMNKKK